MLKSSHAAHLTTISFSICLVIPRRNTLPQYHSFSLSILSCFIFPYGQTVTPISCFIWDPWPHSSMYFHCLSALSGETSPAGCGQVPAALQTESRGKGTGPSPGQRQGQLHGGDPQAQVSAEHQERTDSYPQASAQG